MLTRIRGTLQSVSDETAILLIEPFELEVLISEHTRRTIQTKLGESISLYTIVYIEGGAMVSRLVPRVVGFLSPIDREFFDIFCSVDGVGVRKALRAMVRPVRDLARTIEEQDVKQLSTFPGIGEATAERIVAKLRRKVGKFALIVTPGPGEAHGIRRSQRRPRERRAGRHPRHVRRPSFSRTLREPGARSDRPRPVRQKEIQVSGRYDRSDLSAKSIGKGSSGRPRNLHEAQSLQSFNTHDAKDAPCVSRRSRGAPGTTSRNRRKSTEPRAADPVDEKLRPQRL